VKFGDNGTKLAIGKGIVHLPIDKHKIVSIKNVYYVLGLARN
jgi:predicted transcriptional regulator of viral defense system